MSASQLTEDDYAQESREMGVSFYLCERNSVFNEKIPLVNEKAYFRIYDLVSKSDVR